MGSALRPILDLRGLNHYLRSYKILAQSQELALRHQDVVLAHLESLGLRLNAKKNVLSPAQRTTYLGVVWDSITMQAQLSPARVESFLNALKNIKLGQIITVHYIQRDQLRDAGLPPDVVETILSARAPSTRRSYAFKWHIFENWCMAHHVDPVHCQVVSVLEFLQEKLSSGTCPGTLSLCRRHFGLPCSH